MSWEQSLIQRSTHGLNLKIRTSSTGANYLNMIKRHRNNKYIYVQCCTCSPQDRKSLTAPPAKSRTRVPCSFTEPILTADSDMVESNSIKLLYNLHSNNSNDNITCVASKCCEVFHKSVIMKTSQF